MTASAAAAQLRESRSSTETPASRNSGLLLASVIWKMANRRALLGIVPQCVQPPPICGVALDDGDLACRA